jgi:hypothetical protein
MRKYRKLSSLTSESIMIVDLMRKDAIAHLSSNGFNVGRGDGSTAFVRDKTIVEEVKNKRGGHEFDTDWYDRETWADIMDRLK